MLYVCGSRNGCYYMNFRYKDTFLFRMNRKKGFQLNDFLIEIEKLEESMWFSVSNYCTGKCIRRLLYTSNSNKIKENLPFKMNNLLPYAESKIKHNIYLISSYIIKVGHLFFLNLSWLTMSYDIFPSVFIKWYIFTMVCLPKSNFLRQYLFSRKKKPRASALFVV